MEEQYKKLSDAITKVLRKRWESEREENPHSQSNGQGLKIRNTMPDEPSPQHPPVPHTASTKRRKLN